MRNRRGSDYLLLIFSIVSLVLLLLPLTGRVQAFRAVVSYLFNPVPYYGSQVLQRLSGLPSDAARLISQDLELLRLRRELKEAALIRSEVASLRIENERLLDALGIKPQPGWVIRWARVMERDPLHWHRSVMVDAGKDDGVHLSAPVLGIVGERVGVVGRVVEVGRNTAKVLLLTDDLSAIAAHIPEKKWEGLVQGNGHSRVRMNYLPVEAKLQVGDRVVTSPTSVMFPSNLMIGTVSKVFPAGPFLTFQSVEVTPAVPVDMLKEVMILEPERESTL